MHEKTILLVAIPIILYFPRDPLICLWFLQISTFSMIPLLVVDQLILAFAITNILYLLLIRLTVSLTSERSGRNAKWDVLSLSRISENRLLIILFYTSTIFGCASLLASLLFVSPPNNLPFLFPLLISVYSCIHFLIIFLYFDFKQLTNYEIVKTESYFSYSNYIQPVTTVIQTKKRV